jgi:hypothetical protein
VCCFQQFQIKGSGMRFILALAVGAVCVGLSLTAASADRPKTGSIQGSVNFCQKGGVEGMQVYIPGLPYVVITGEDGRFQLRDLPEGKYDLHYRLDGRLLNRNVGVHVSGNQVSNLSAISFCDPTVATTEPVSMQSATVPVPAEKACDAGSLDPACQDADGDGVSAALDCDDKNPKTHPGAIELCDGVDNNCNGQIDENASVFVLHGIGMCQAGQVVIQRCKDGFGDCDGQATNGCEMDINNDVEHCGSCNNSCTPTEICVTGDCI